MFRAKMREQRNRWAVTGEIIGRLTVNDSAATRWLEH